MSTPLRPVEWKAEEYDAQSAPHEEWQAQILERLDLKGDETVLDAGCGTGRLTKELVERVPNGKVIGVDASAQMLEKAREHLGEDFDLRHQDLTRLDISEQVDAVYSSAVFHWIEDHEALYRSLHGAMRPGARLEAQCGGDGNIAEIERALEALAGDERFAPYLRGEREAWNYASIEDTRLRLAAAGFSDVRVWTQPWPVSPKDPRGYVSTVILPWHLNRLPEDLHESFVRAVLETAPRPLVVNYVRLNISAIA
jgi:trans-aconitate 2-methyltransferase